MKSEKFICCQYVTAAVVASLIYVTNFDNLLLRKYSAKKIEYVEGCRGVKDLKIPRREVVSRKMFEKHFR